MATSARQQRLIAAILLSTLGLTGVFVAQGGTRLIASAALPLDASDGSPVSLGTVRAAPPRDVDPTGILRRNIFDHETGALDREPQPAVADTDGEEEEVITEPWIPGGPPPPPCDGSMRLVGAFIRMRSAEDSFATITSASGESLLYQSGMDVDDREVVHIEHNRVILRPRGSAVCSLSMFDDAPTVATAPAVAAVSARAEPPGDADSAALEAGITQVSENRYTIERGLVDRLLANQAALMRTARVIPHEEGGRVVGVKLYGIRRSSLLGRLGIQNGDMMRTINGYDMTAPDSALEAYARLRSADRITINLNRRGSDQTIDYQIQ